MPCLRLFCPVNYKGVNYWLNRIFCCIDHIKMRYGGMQLLFYYLFIYLILNQTLYMHGCGSSNMDIIYFDIIYNIYILI